ncbi:hypothetical protein MMC07_004230 [Pseudocyphellaria aurata]|nr:hypothetical protein [Pseudocyphellaria aurata]
MYSLVLISVAAAAIRIVNAQDLSALPACARNAASAGFAQTGCGLSDIKCICNASSFLTSVQSLIVQQCNAPDQQATIAFAVELCQNAGVVLPSAFDSPTPTPTPITTSRAVSAEAESVSSSGNNAIALKVSRSASNVDGSSSVSALVSTFGRSTSPVSSTSASTSSSSTSTASYTSSLSSSLKKSSTSTSALSLSSATSIASPTSTVSALFRRKLHLKVAIWLISLSPRSVHATFEQFHQQYHYRRK